MSVADQTRRIAPITGDGVTRRFSFSPMTIFSADELEVVTTVTATGVDTTVARGTNATSYALTITSFPATGSIDYPAAGGTLMPSTETITIRRVLTLEQLLELDIQGGWDPQAVEDQFDKIMMILLQQQEELDRCIRLPLSYEASGIDGEVSTPLGSDIRYLAIAAARDEISFTAISSADASAGSSAPLADAISGTAGTSADFARDDHVHPKTEIVGGSLTSASPLVVDTDGEYFHVTGTTDFSAMTVAIDRFFVLEFDSVLTMTHGAGTLDLPGELPINTGPGDIAICQATSANVVTVLSYRPALGKPQMWKQGTDVVSGTALLIDDGGTTAAQRLDGNYKDVTGTTTITSMTVPAGNFFMLQFDGALTLTHANGTLDLPGEANITTAAGDRCICFSTAANTVQVLSYFPATGLSIVAAARDGWQFVSAVTASTDATVSFTGMEAGFDYKIAIYNLTPSNDDEDFQSRLGVTGPTYRTSGYIGTTASVLAGTSASVDSTTFIYLTDSKMGTGTDEKGSFELILRDPAAASDTFWLSQGFYNNLTPGEVMIMGGGLHTTAEAMTAVKFEFDTNNVETGEFKLYRRLNT